MGEWKDSTSHLGTALASSEVFELVGCGRLSAAYPGLEARMEPLASARWVQAISFLDQWQCRNRGNRSPPEEEGEDVGAEGRAMKSWVGMA